MKVLTGFEDKNGNEIVKFPAAVTNAVNEITISNAATTGAPSIAVTGNDSNIDLNLITKGSGVLKVNGVALGASADPVVINSQEFTATNGQTIFTLTNGSYIINSDMIQVFVSGVLQPPSSYTETSTTVITFSSGITLNTPVFFKWFEAVSIGAIVTEVSLNGVETLTNKTLTSPKINEDVVLTANATELNVLDGIPSTLTATEIGYLDGVTSAIQTQLTGKKTDSMATNKLLGRGTTATGVIEEITLGTNLALTGTTLNVTQSDIITISAVEVPAAPATGKISIFARKRAGRILPNFIGPSGIDSAVQPALFGNQVYLWSPSNSTTVSIAFGTAWTARNTTGAQSTPTKSTAGFINQMARALFNSTTAVNTASGIQSAQTVCVRGNADNIGGFYAFFRFGVETLVATGQQLFVGLTAGLNGVLAGEPSALLNSIAMTKDSGETVWQILTRNGSGTVTKYSTGETVTAGRVYDLHIFCKPNDTKVTIRLVRLNDGVVLIDDVEFSTTLPVATTFMYAEAHLRSTGTAVNSLALNRIYVECDF